MVSGRDSYRENLLTETINKALTEVETEAMTEAESEAEKGTRLHNEKYRVEMKCISKKI